MSKIETTAIILEEFGGPEVLKAQTIEVPAPKKGEVRVRHTAIGVNLLDTNLRKGVMPVELPSGIGSEAAGIVESVGKGVESLKPGTKVVGFTPVPGAYRGVRNYRQDDLLRLPRGIDDETAAASYVKGTTAWALLREAYRVRKGDVVLLWAAAGGVGQIATQWARHLGAEIIGVVGSQGKARLARKLGCQHALVASEDLADRVRRLTKGKGVDVVYDSVGKDSLMISMACLRPRGMLVGFGNASGPPPAISPMELMKHGSIYLTRMSGADYIGKPEQRARAAREFYALVRRGVIRISVNQRYALEDAAKAHSDLEARRTTGSSILIP